MAAQAVLEGSAPEQPSARSCACACARPDGSDERRPRL